MYCYESDIELLAALKQKERGAYSVIFNRFARQLIYFIESITDNTQVAQDLATESFIKVLIEVTIFLLFKS